MLYMGSLAGRMHSCCNDLLFASITELSTELLLLPFLLSPLSINQVYFECQDNKCISTFVKAHEGTRLVAGSLWSHCLACVSNISVLVPGSPSSKQCQNSFDHYIKKHQRTILLHENSQQSWQPLLTKAPGLCCMQTSLAFCTDAKVSNFSPVFRVMANLRNHKWRWTHRGHTKTLSSSSAAIVSCTVFNTTASCHGSDREGIGTAVLSCSQMGTI